MSLYADDVLLYITMPQVTISKILEKINSFGAFFGYKINWSQSELMPIREQNPYWLQNRLF